MRCQRRRVTFSGLFYGRDHSVGRRAKNILFKWRKVIWLLCKTPFRQFLGLLIFACRLCCQNRRLQKVGQTVLVERRNTTGACALPCKALSSASMPRIPVSDWVRLRRRGSLLKHPNSGSSCGTVHSTFEHVPEKVSSDRSAASWKRPQLSEIAKSGKMHSIYVQRNTVPNNAIAWQKRSFLLLLLCFRRFVAVEPLLLRHTCAFALSTF